MSFSTMSFLDTYIHTQTSDGFCSWGYFLKISCYSAGGGCGGGDGLEIYYYTLPLSSTSLPPVYSCMSYLIRSNNGVQQKQEKKNNIYHKRMMLVMMMRWGENQVHNYLSYYGILQIRKSNNRYRQTAANISRSAYTHWSCGPCVVYTEKISLNNSITTM